MSACVRVSEYEGIVGGVGGGRSKRERERERGEEKWSHP